MQRPTSVTVFGILNILKAGADVFLQIFTIGLLLTPLDSNNSIVKMLHDSPAYAAWIKLCIPLGLLSAAVLLTTGIGLLFLKSWARKLSMAYAIYSICFCSVATAINSGFLFQPFLKNEQDPKAAADAGRMVRKLREMAQSAQGELKDSGVDISGITNDGVDAASFTVSNLVATVSPAGSTNFTVNFAPASAGIKIAALHIASNATNNPFNINLTGTGTNATAPIIGVQQPLGTSLVSGITNNFGSVTVGTNTSLTFTITNSGNADLTGLGITINGADAGMFTVTANPTAPVQNRRLVRR